jgi:cytochrome c biogenesis protein
VRHDPGKEAALVFAVLAMTGLVASLFVPRRRVWVRASPEPGGTGRTLVEVGALARGEDGGLAREADDLVTALRGRDRTGG